jgi:hypothetical protein
MTCKMAVAFEHSGTQFGHPSNYAASRRLCSNAVLFASGLTFFCALANLVTPSTETLPHTLVPGLQSARRRLQEV